jgi:hypothetical protein
MDFLNECQSCKNIIQFKKAVCPLCGAFQMHLDEEIEDKKMESFSLMSERRYLCQLQVDKMVDDDISDEEIDDLILEFYEKEQEIKENIIKKLDKYQKYLLN